MSESKKKTKSKSKTKKKSTVKKKKERAYTKAELVYGAILRDLNSQWTPHHKQAVATASIFKYGKKTTFLEWGRKGGKTDVIIYILYRMALHNPGSASYYIAPFQNHVTL